jgi:colanic acid/amylovoran biosynthesis protein
MNILVTGLCLQGNKGGPALALSLMKLLRRELGDIRFTFSVPESDIVEESQWATKYSVAVIPNCAWPSPRAVLAPRRRRNLVNWIRRLRQADLVVDLTAISYVGPPIGRPHRLPRVLCEARFRWCVYARLFGKKFLAWTQSYGPFSTWDLRWAGAFDLKRQKYVFCRGEETVREVRGLLKDAKAISFPDVAVILDYDAERGSAYIKEMFPGIACERLVTVSPSAVLYSSTRPDPNKHLLFMREMVKYLLDRGHSVLLVPHTYRVRTKDPSHCDFTLAKAISEGMKAPAGTLAVVQEDLSPQELKGIIACARAHVGGRYHSVVAALSSGVPCISLSWHHKYKDIMAMYGVDEYTMNCIGDVDLNGFSWLFDRLMENAEEIRDSLAREQDRIS